MGKDRLQGCPICHSQGKMTIMEGREGDKNITCAIHGDISLKYWHDIFIDPFYEKHNVLISCAAFCVG
jgi:hypothetical protein